MTYSEIIQHNCEMVTPAWWPKYAYHFTDVTNAVSILSSGYLYSRDVAGMRGVMKNENASRQVIDMTNVETTSFVRSYFRPLTPTQYFNEGYKHIRIRYSGDSGANIPVPVFLLFDLEKLLSMKETTFSAQGQAGHGSPTFRGVESFAKLPFDKIYSDGPCDKETMSYRHAEILYPDTFMINEALRGIFCRNVYDRSTLLNMLKEKDTRAYYRYKDMIRVAKNKTYYRNGFYVEQVLFNNGVLSFAFSDGLPKRTYANRYRGNDELPPITVDFIFEWSKAKRIITRRMLSVQVDYMDAKPIGFRVPSFAGTTKLRVTVSIDNKIICVTEQPLADSEII